MMGGELADAGVDSEQPERRSGGRRRRGSGGGPPGESGTAGHPARDSIDESCGRAARRRRRGRARLPLEKEALAFLQRAFSKQPLHPAHARRARAARSVASADGRAGRARPRRQAGRRGAAQSARRRASPACCRTRGLPASALGSAEGAARLSLLAQRTLQVDATSAASPGCRQRSGGARECDRRPVAAPARFAICETTRP